MSLFDRLFKKDDIFTDYANNMQPLQPLSPELPVIQAEGGPQIGQPTQPAQGQKPTFRQRIENARGALADALLGKRAEGTDNIDTSGDAINATISKNPRVGGLFNDIMSGARENFATGFAADNWGDNYTADGRRKGLAYRIGEGLGTLGRFGESSPGRALITAGLVGATGGDALDMLAYGGQAGALNNKLRTQDRMYRDEMIRNAQNSLMNSPQYSQLSEADKIAAQQQLLADMYTQEDGTVKALNNLTDDEMTAYTNALQGAYDNRLRQNQQSQLDNISNQVNRMRGYVTPEMYDNFVKAQQLRENADWRKMYFDTEQRNREEQRKDRQAQFEYNKLKDAADRAFKLQQLASENEYRKANLGLGYAKLAAAREAQLNKENKLSAAQKEAQGTLAQINMIRQMVKNNPKATGWGKGMLTGDLLNRVDSNKNNIETRTAIDALRTKIRHDLTGAQFSPKEAREYEKFLPNVRDNPQIINAKLDALEKRYYSDFGVSLTGDTNNNPLGLNL